MPEMTLIRIDHLLEPARAARTEMDEDALESLTESIRALGVKEPLLVFPAEDDHYEVVAGHRRLLASRRAGLIEVPCIVETDPEAVAAIRLHENIEREELHPADEAMVFSELYDALGQDVDAVAAKVRKSRAYVESRLLLLRGNTKVWEALAGKKIALGIATELNKMHRSEDAEWYLSHAIRAGASTRLVREWRQQANARAELEREQAERAKAAAPADGSAAPAAPPTPNFDAARAPWEFSDSMEPRPCMFCGEKHPEWRMYRRFLCAPCAEKWEREQKDQR